MKYLFRNTMYQGKNTYRDRYFIFWSVLYPIIMAIFFYISFNGMLNTEIQNINVGIREDSPIEAILEEIDIINIHKVLDADINEKLEDKEIDGFVDDDLSILVNRSGINQTIIKEVVDQIKQMIKLNRPIESYDFSVDYIIDRNQKSNSIIVTFYSLIAMVSTYGIFPGIETVSIIQANLSNVGTRINVTPLKKSNFLFAGVIVSLILNLLSNMVLLLFIRYILKINLFSEIKYSAIFILLGNLFGVCFGILIGASNKQKGGVKTMIGIMVTLLFSFLSGMMGPYIKVMLDKSLPILGKINPVAIISNNLYRVNLLGSTKSVNSGILVLTGYCVVFVLLSYIFLRRRQYDSI